MVEKKRRQRVFKTAGILVTVIAVVAIGLFLFNRLFPVDPRLREGLHLADQRRGRHHHRRL